MDSQNQPWYNRSNQRSSFSLKKNIQFIIIEKLLSQCASKLIIHQIVTVGI